MPPSDLRSASRTCTRLHSGQSAEDREEELQRHRDQITAAAQARRLRDVCARSKSAAAVAAEASSTRTSELTSEALQAHNMMTMSSAQAANDATRRQRRLSSASIDSAVSAENDLDALGAGLVAGEKKRRTSSGSVCSITEGHEAGFSIDGTRRASTIDPATIKHMHRQSFTASAATFSVVPSPQASPAIGKHAAWAKVPATPPTTS